MSRSNDHHEKIPVCQVRRTGILLYDLPIDHHGGRRGSASNSLFKKKETQDETLPGDKKIKAYSGDMTKGSIQRLKKAVNTLVAIADWKTSPLLKKKGTFRWKLNFITLTLPSSQGSISDKEIKSKCLNPWLKAMTRKFGLKNYIWKAEKQDNGNLHFHLTTDIYLLHTNIRNEWNYYINKLGYVDRFALKHGHSNPNSIDVHATYKVKNLAAYLIKYITKQNKENQKVEGKMWDCSENLKTRISCQLEIDSALYNQITDIVKQVPDQVRSEDFFSFIWLSEEQFDKLITGRLLSEWLRWKETIRHYVRQ